MQSFNRSLLYNTHLISPILFVVFLSLVLARRLLSACLVISPTNFPYMVLHAPLDNNQIFLQSTPAITFSSASSISHYSRSASRMQYLSAFSSNMSHCIHMRPSMRLWKAATSTSESSTGDCGLLMTRSKMQKNSFVYILTRLMVSCLYFSLLLVVASLPVLNLSRMRDVSVRLD